MAFFKRKRPADQAPDNSATGDKPTVSPIVTLIVADLAVRAGEKLVRRGVERGLLDGKPAKTSRVIRGPTFKETILGTVAAEVARRSVPGAILVGGGLIAKVLRDRRLAKKALKAPDQD